MAGSRPEIFDRMYMDIAERISEMSYAQRAKVGAVIVKDDNIISFGYNGTPAGHDNCCEVIGPDALLHTKREVLHAESNALMKLVKSGIASSQGATIYVTYSPCIECSKLIVQAGITRVVYKTKYETDGGIGLQLLKDSGIKTEQI